MAERTMDGDRTLAQKLALLFGATFLLVGILGFIPGITSNYDEMGFAGPDSEAMLLGIFQTSILHNIVHLLFGVGILMARAHDSAKNYLLWGGVIYVVLFLYGLFVAEDASANFPPLNNADDVLHAILAAGLLGSYFASKRADDRVGDRGMAGTT